MTNKLLFFILSTAKKDNNLRFLLKIDIGAISHVMGKIINNIFLIYLFYIQKYTTLLEKMTIYKRVW